ncbi:MAG TPA: DUF1573 domain-containing protein [Candidatus Hydrogenedens sp.]|nr:DUF1573 domain-containing protein [Candidatus Hydrogenedens sp.]HOL20588.1 DUF1573 domain-containing protein [Candidatus Hydrogenedens sp.]HPP57643.1 DUF1573 domain-containing protein [Candidatus Hydrogenedens sp.]
MKIFRTQYIVFSVLFLCCLFVLFIVVKSQQQRSEENQIESPYQPSLPPLGSNQGETAQIELETGSIFDMGTVPNDVETTKKLKVFNRGKAVLSLKDIRTSCACTQGTIPAGQNVIPPNGEGYILITIYPSRVVGFYSEKTLTIFSNDYKNPVLELKVKAHIEPEFIFEPEEVQFGNFQKGTLLEQKIHITQKFMKKPLEIFKIYERNLPENIESDLIPDLVKIKSEEPIEYMLTIKTTPKLSPGEFKREFFLSTNIDRFPEVPLKVKGSVIAPYKINYPFPKPLNIMPTPSNIPMKNIIEILPETETETIEVISHQFIPDIFTIQNILSNTTGLKIEVMPKGIEKGTSGVLDLKLRVNGKEYNEHVLLKTLTLGVQE